MSPLRILVCLDSLAAGGAQRQTVELLKRLDPHSFSLRVVTLHGSRMDLSRHFVPDLAAAGIPVVELDRRWHWSELPAIVGGVRREVRWFRPDVVHSISHHSNHVTRMVRLMPGLRFRLLTAIRTEYNSRQLRNERWEQRLSDLVVCNSPSMASKLRTEARIPDARLLYIPNGLDVARFTTSPDPLLRSRLSPGALRLGVMMARITEQKAPELLAEAIGLLRRSGRLPTGTVFWIVGERDSAATQARLDDAIRRHGLADRVFQFPATDQPAAFYHAADFTVLASLWEGTPNAVLESLACGRPALVSEAANAAGVIRPGVDGWSVTTSDIASLADGLSSVLALSTAELSAMAPACRSRAAEFDLPSMVQRYADLYRRLAGGSTTVPSR